MIRILHVIGSLDVGGSQMLMLNLYNNINRDKIQFDFIVREGRRYWLEDKITSLGGKIYHLPSLQLTNLYTYIKAWKTFFKEHPEYRIIHGHVRSTASIYLTIAKCYGLTTIAHSHNTSSGKGLSGIIKNILQYPLRYIANYFLSCSIAAGEWLFGKKIVYRKNFHILHNAIDTHKLGYCYSIRQQIRTQLGIHTNLVIGHVGRMVTQKNHIFLLQIFAEIYKQNTNARLLLVGDGPLKEQLIRQTEQMNIKPAVLFCANQEASRYYQVMDVFLFPSLYEGLGIVLIEAQTAGLPCVISDTLPQEADLQCNLITRISLKQNPCYWAQQVLAQVGKVRQSRQDIAKNKGYDVATTAKWLEDFYSTI